MWTCNHKRHALDFLHRNSNVFFHIINDFIIKILIVASCCPEPLWFIGDPASLARHNIVETPYLFKGIYGSVTLPLHCLENDGDQGEWLSQPYGCIYKAEYRPSICFWEWTESMKNDSDYMISLCKAASPITKIKLWNTFTKVEHVSLKSWSGNRPFQTFLWLWPSVLIPVKSLINFLSVDKEVS